VIRSITCGQSKLLPLKVTSTRQSATHCHNDSSTALHAAVLGFTHPTSGERMRFEAPDPADFAAALEVLEGRER
jgi:hypothetical protein